MWIKEVSFRVFALCLFFCSSLFAEFKFTGSGHVIGQKVRQPGTGNNSTVVQKTYFEWKGRLYIEILHENNKNNDIEIKFL